MFCTCFWESVSCVSIEPSRHSKKPKAAVFWSVRFFRDIMLMLAPDPRCTCCCRCVCGLRWSSKQCTRIGSRWCFGGVYSSNHREYKQQKCFNRSVSRYPAACSCCCCCELLPLLLLLLLCCFSLPSTAAGSWAVFGQKTVREL